MAALQPPLSAREGHEQGDRALQGRRVTADRPARGVDLVAERGIPLGELPNQVNHAFHDCTCGSVIDSIRSPIEPTISGGPCGRGPRGMSSASVSW